jgi:hypothetical protein
MVSDFISMAWGGAVETFFEPLPAAMTAAFLVMAFLYCWEARRLFELKERFRVIVDADAEADRILKEAASVAAKMEKEAIQAEQEIAALRASYAVKREHYDRLVKEVAIFDDKLAFAEMGVYEPHFDFTDSERIQSSNHQSACRSEGDGHRRHSSDMRDRVDSRWESREGQDNDNPQHQVDTTRIQRRMRCSHRKHPLE